MKTVRLIVAVPLTMAIALPLLIVGIFCTPERQTRLGEALAELVRAFVE